MQHPKRVLPMSSGTDGLYTQGLTVPRCMDPQIVPSTHWTWPQVRPTTAVMTYHGGEHTALAYSTLQTIGVLMRLRKTITVQRPENQLIVSAIPSRNNTIRFEPVRHQTNRAARHPTAWAIRSWGTLGCCEVSCCTGAAPHLLARPCCHWSCELLLLQCLDILSSLKASTGSRTRLVR